MVRTRADNTARKAVAAKAPRKVLGSSGGASSSSMMSPSGKTSKYAGGNLACPRPTPDWQKGISGFLVKSPPKSNKDKENESPEEMGESSASSQEPTSCSQENSSAEPSSQSSGSSSAGSSAERNGIIDDSDDED